LVEIWIRLPQVKAWMGAAKSGAVAELKSLLAADAWLLTNRSEETAEKQVPHI